MDVPLDKDRHLRYLKRCLRSLLPYQYTSNDSIRMTLGCFIIAAVDLLTPTTTAPPTAPLLTPSDRRLFREWVLACQHPGGGFAGSPTHALPAHEYESHGAGHGGDEAGSLGVANIAATFFALQLLALLAEEQGSESAFAGVNRAATLSWLKRLQRGDGSFGEVLAQIPGRDGGGTRLISGGRDMRYCYLAAMIRWVLRGDVRPGQPGWVEDVDVGALVGHIRRSQTYDGGFSESSTHESHAGYSFCAVAALALLDRPADQTGPGVDGEGPALRRGISDRPALVKWLAARSFAYAEPPDAADEDPENFLQPPALSALDLPEGAPAHVGYNGRCNKVADTCYCWWVGGTLSILGEPNQLRVPASRRFLLERTQHLIGGFAKHPGGPPDIYHAYLGLAALATMGEPGLKGFDPTLCISSETVRKMGSARGGLLARGDGAGKAEEGVLAMGLELLGRQPDWLVPVR